MTDVRTAAEHVRNIREVLNPPVADLASLLEVSHQTIHQWLSGDAMPEASRFGRIHELSRIVDAFRGADRYPHTDASRRCIP